MNVSIYKYNLYIFKTYYLYIAHLLYNKSFQVNQFEAVFWRDREALDK